ncbi:glycosyltransferase family 61 protein [Oceanibium sediminis]|uniref:glycosyltransferase family 61 protein n=1 Tax=Oceanibium sediminis TaxID=2026339 RepID=UPI001E3068A7|nr:glycosyltransferase family 61 protein [Oceanibium sediminis]
MLISRADAPTRKISNEDEVFKALQPLGFERIRATDYSHAEQVSIFRNAEVIVGAHGANLANLIFASPGAQVFEITNQQFMNRFYSFADLANLRGLRYRLLVADEDGDMAKIVNNVGNNIRMSPVSVRVFPGLPNRAAAYACPLAPQGILHYMTAFPPLSGGPDGPRYR